MYTLEHAKLTQSYLRSEVFASTSLASYKFPIKSNDQFNAVAQQPTEQRLQLQDLFVVSSVGLFLGTGASGNSSYKLFSFPDATTFATGAASLMTIYNGNLSLAINNNTIVPAWDTFRHLAIPNQQTAANAYYTTSGVNYVSESNGSVQGFYPCEPNWLLSGGANLDLELNLPAAPATLDANTRLILIVRGVLAQNVTTVK